MNIYTKVSKKEHDFVFMLLIDSY